MKTIIYDFDGTLADSLEVSIKLYNKLAAERGFKLITAENREGFRNLGARQGILAAGIRFFQLPGIGLRLRSDFAHVVHEVHPPQGMSAMLLELHKRGFQQGILTSNAADTVRQFLANNNINLFDFIHSEYNIFGKAPVLRKIVKERHLQPADAVYIGDEVRDIEAARKAGIKVFAVTWGFNSRKVLEQNKPDAIVDRPEEIFKFLDAESSSVIA